MYGYLMGCVFNLTRLLGLLEMSSECMCYVKMLSHFDHFNTEPTIDRNSDPQKSHPSQILGKNLESPKS